MKDRTWAVMKRFFDGYARRRSNRSLSPALQSVEQLIPKSGLPIEDWGPIAAKL